MSGRLSSVQALHAAGASLAAMDAIGSTAVHVACAKDSVDVLAWLLARGCDHSTRGGEGMQPLHWCGQFGAVRCAVALLESGADASSNNSR